MLNNNFKQKNLDFCSTQLRLKPNTKIGLHTKHHPPRLVQLCSSDPNYSQEAKNEKITPLCFKLTLKVQETKYFQFSHKYAISWIVYDV